MDRAPPEHVVRLDHQHPMTGLSEPCCAVCTFPVHIEAGRVRMVAGKLPKADHEKVLERIRELAKQGVISLSVLFPPNAQDATTSDPP
jgi:hypothetical protein